MLENEIKHFLENISLFEADLSSQKVKEVYHSELSKFVSEILAHNIRLEIILPTLTKTFMSETQFEIVASLLKQEHPNMYYIMMANNSTCYSDELLEVGNQVLADPKMAKTKKPHQLH